MMLQFKEIFTTVLVAFLLAGSIASGATYYVNGGKGTASFDGLSPERPFPTIQKACDVVAAGDTVIVSPGVYFENVSLRAAGTVGNPITFKTEKLEKNGTVITGAAPAIRKREVEWKLEDSSLNLYSAPLDYTPTRALYSGTDLYPYANLALLKRFYSTDVVRGPKHGFACEGGRVYVRLHPGGKYGPTNPREHTMAFSPAGSRSSWAGTKVDQASDYNFGILAEKPSYVIIDGFTFETPGITGVYVINGYATIRNCWFFGCKSGVGGKMNTRDDPTGYGARPPGFDYNLTTNGVVVENCYYTQFPIFSELVETIRNANPSTEKDQFFYWQRKGNSKSRWGIPSSNGYELGIASCVGKDWEVRNNHFFEVWDGCSYTMTGYSDGLKIHDNIFERVCDNAVEAESHPSNLRFYRNVVIDCFEPLSWQPEHGLPWPGPVYIYQNIIYNTAGNARLWEKVWPERGWVKAGASNGNWESYNPHMKNVPKSPITAGGTGFLVYNNTVYFPGSHVLSTIGQDKEFRGFKFSNNIIVSGELSQKKPAYRAPAMEFCNNVYAPGARGEMGSQSVLLAGVNGKVLDDADAIGMADPANGKFELTASSPARGTGKEVPGADGWLPDAGAIPYGTPWAPPVVGPQPMK